MSLFGSGLSIDGLDMVMHLGSQPDVGIESATTGGGGSGQGEAGGAGGELDAHSEVGSGPGGTTQSATDRGGIVVKTWCGCKLTNMQPSPLCVSDGGFRDWDYPKFGGCWDKHCASVARVRFLQDHGSMLGVQTWIEESEENFQFFNLRVMAYMSLKVDASAGLRTTTASIESRVGVILTHRTWERCGPALGVPCGSKLSMVYPIKQSADIFGNPLLNGGLVAPLDHSGVASIGVSVPLPRKTDGQPLIERSSDNDIPLGAEVVMADVNMRTEDPEALQCFKQLFSEYQAVTAARATEPTGRRTFLGSVVAGSSPPSKNAMFGVEALVPYRGDGAGSTTRVTASASGDGTCGDEAASSTNPEASAPPTTPKGPKSKIAKLLAEMEEKMNILSQEKWETLCCDKNLEGLLKRAANAKVKALEDCDTESSSRISGLQADLNLIYVFGQLHKKQSRKKDESSLASLTQVVKDLKSSKALSDII